MPSHLLVDKASVSKVRRLIRSELARAGVGPSTAFDCLVAVTEACSRAMRDVAENGEGHASIDWAIDPGCARFEVGDTSGPEAAIEAHPSRPPRQHDDGGEAGEPGEPGELEMLYKLMDEVHADNGGRGLRLSLVKRFTP